tara:strand:+ start:3113 stop:3424 length:312 start_codon:yes stop_codon:yes gene_type:complete
MPYITYDARHGNGLCDFASDLADYCNNGGDINFAFCTIIDAFIRQKGLRYQTISDIIGALEGAKAEFQRRIVGPYEDQKLAENGEVFHTTHSMLNKIKEKEND